MKLRFGIALLATLIAGPACERKTEVERREPVETTGKTEPAAPGTVSEDQQPVAGREVALTVRTEEGTSFQTTDREIVRSVEAKLAASGNDPGAIDGVVDTKLISALRAFQSDNQLVVSGMLDRKTSDALGLDWKSVTATGGATLEDRAREGYRDVREGVKDVGGEIEEGGRAIEEGTKEFGRDVKKGTQEVGRDIEEGAKDVERDLRD